MAITDIFAGDGGTLLKEIKTVDLTAQCDGIVSTFTMPEVYLSGSLWVSWNGLTLCRYNRGVTNYLYVVCYPSLNRRIDCRL